MPKLVRFKDQDHDAIVKECMSTGTPFTDSHFPTSSSSLGDSGSRGNITWLRSSDISPLPTLIRDGIDRDDLQQGSLGSCWFLASAAMLAQRKKLVSKVIPNAEEDGRLSRAESEELRGMGIDPDNQVADDSVLRGIAMKRPKDHWSVTGVLRFRFWRYGKETEVVIDDRLPCDSHSRVPIFARSRDANEMWCAYLEKAYAKLYGSYAALDGGDATDALVDFTGGIGESISIRECGLDSEEFYRKVDKFSRGGALMSASISTDPSEIEAIQENGLVKGHAYSVTGIFNLKLEGHSFFNNKKQTVIRLRNPWGKQEFNGPWSDGSREWQSIHKKDRDRFGLVADDDGEFFMSFDDFLDQFTRIVVVNSVNTDLISFRSTWHSHFFESSWSLNDGTIEPWKSGGKRGSSKKKVSGNAACTAGGCRNNKETFSDNPQFLVEVKDPQELIVAVHQEDARGRDDIEHAAIGYVVLRVECNRPEKIRSARLDEFEVAARVTYINSREVASSFELQRGKYIIVPTTFDPEIERGFLLRVFAEKSGVTVKELKRSVLKRKWFWQSKYKYTLRIVVHGFSGGKSLGLVDKGDSYVSAAVGGTKATTSVIKQNAIDPTWEEPMIFPLTKVKKNTSLVLQFWDKDLLFDDFVGQTALRISEYEKSLGDRYKLDLSLKDRGGKTIQGTLSVSVQLDKGTE